MTHNCIVITWYNIVIWIVSFTNRKYPLIILPAYIGGFVGWLLEWSQGFWRRLYSGMKSHIQLHTRSIECLHNAVSSGEWHNFYIRSYGCLNTALYSSNIVQPQYSKVQKASMQFAKINIKGVSPQITLIAYPRNRYSIIGGKNGGPSVSVSHIDFE